MFKKIKKNKYDNSFPDYGFHFRVMSGRMKLKWDNVCKEIISF